MFTIEPPAAIAPAARRLLGEVAQPVDVDPQHELGPHRAGHAGDVAERVEGPVELRDDGIDRRRVGEVAREVPRGALGGSFMSRVVT